MPDLIGSWSLNGVTNVLSVAPPPTSADFIIPASTSTRVISNATNTAYGTTLWSSLATGGKTRPQAGDIIEIAGGTSGSITLNINGSASGDIIFRAAATTQRTIISAAVTFVFSIENCSYLTVDGQTIGSQYGLLITAPSSTSGVGHFIKYKGLNHHITFRNFEIDGKITSWAPGSRVVSGANATNPIGIQTSTSISGFLSAGDNVAFGGMTGGFSVLNGNSYRVLSASTTTNQITIGDLNSGSPINGTGFAAYTGGGTVYKCPPGVPIGMGMHDNNETLANNPGAFQYNLTAENFYIHNVAGEGIYSGPNWTTQAVPMKDIIIRNAVIEDAGRDAIQGKAWYEGDNRIYNIQIRRVGRNVPDIESGQLFGISVLSGQGKVYNCQIYDIGESGIQGYVQNGPYQGVIFNGHGPYNQFVVEFYNNLVVRTGISNGVTANQGNGITAGSGSPSTSQPSYVLGAVVVPPLAKFYNNTVYGTENSGINVGTGAAASGFVMNNIIVPVNTGATALNLRSGVTNLGNYTSGITFVNPSNSFNAPNDNYHLTATKLVDSTSTLGVNVANLDIENVQRTSVATANAGAYQVVNISNLAPVWSTTPGSSLGVFNNTATNYFQLVATDPNAGDTITYTRTATTNTNITVSSSGLVTIPSGLAVAVYSITVAATDNQGASTPATFSIDVRAATTRNIYYNGDFSSAGVPDRSSLNGGGYVGCKFEPEGNYNDFYQNSTGNNTTASNLDCRVVQQDVWQGETITPRSGTHFMRQAIYWNKQYECLNGATHGIGANDHDEGYTGDPAAPCYSGKYQKYDASGNLVQSADKPRVKFDLSNPVYEFDWNQEMWFGFSIYLPRSHVGETLQANSGDTMVFVLNATASNTQCALFRGCYNSQTTEHWWFLYQVNSTMIADMDGGAGAPKTRYIDLGPTSDSKSKWTDFVIRCKFNPFTANTNPYAAGITNDKGTVFAKNQTYPANQGIMQIWKGFANDPAGLQRYHSVVNGPVGGVPVQNLMLESSFRMYKYAWKKWVTASTAPIYHGFDAIRWGWADPIIAAAKGQPGPTRSQDVNPSGQQLV